MVKIKQMIEWLKEIQEGKEPKLPYGIIRRSVAPIDRAGCIEAVIYLLEQLEN